MKPSEITEEGYYWLINRPSMGQKLCSRVIYIFNVPEPRFYDKQWLPAGMYVARMRDPYVRPLDYYSGKLWIDADFIKIKEPILES